MPLIGAGCTVASAGAGRWSSSREVALQDRAEHRPAELSGGESQRVAVARALANEPKLLLADEPTGALDSATSARVLDLLLRLRDQLGMTLIIVSHDRSVGNRTDRTVTLIDGRVEPECSDVELYKG